MSIRRKPNPNRNFPTHCPYCAGEDLVPNEITDFGWKCGECLRVFEVKFHGQDDPEVRPNPVDSTHEALERSLKRHAGRQVLGRAE